MIMRRHHMLILLIACTLAVGSLTAQPLGVVVRDEFADNAGRWRVGQWNNGTVSIANGRYVIDRRSIMNEWFLESGWFIDYDADFDIDVKLRQVAGATNQGFGVSWAASTAQNANGVLVNSGGNYKVYTWRDGRQRDVLPWTPSQEIPAMGTWFTLTVRKRGSGMSLLINGGTIVGFDGLDIQGAILGLVVNGQMLIEVDEVVIRQRETGIDIADDVPVLSDRESLGPRVNSYGGDLSPVITTNGKRLYFGRYPHRENIGDPDEEDIWYTDMQPDGSWGQAVNIGRPLNNQGANFLISITPDENQVLVGNTYYANGAPRGPGVSQSVRTANGWSIPREVRIDNYYNLHRFSESCLDPSGRVLLQAIQRRDSRGQKDLYFSRKRADGTFTEPINCGQDINTWGSEMSPFMAADGVTLYFASDGRRGYGNVDIWMTRRLDDSWTKWSKPKNLGPKINTPEWDAYFTVPANGEYAYLCGTSPVDQSADLYRIRLTKGVQPQPVVLVSGRVLDASTKKPIATNVEYESLTTRVSAGTALSEPVRGSYKIVLPAGDLYGFRAEAPGYYPVSDKLDTRSLTQYTELERDLYLVPIRKNEVIRLNNLFFDVAKSELRPESYTELDRLSEFLAANAKITIELSGHTDNVGQDAENKKLSQERVNAVRTYLVSKGVNEKRMRAIGLGKSKPLGSNATEEGRQRNRRVEFKIVSM
jgi:outer membrane protein OmpA-like peptidoglycan-associated protein